MDPPPLGMKILVATSEIELLQTQKLLQEVATGKTDLLQERQICYRKLIEDCKRNIFILGYWKMIN